MNTFSSEICSSGCESGWTLYLEQSFLNQKAGGTEGSYEEEHKDKRFKDEEEEDLSMVSDASSGPPHFPDYDEANYFNEEVNGCFYSASKKAVMQAKSGTKKKKIKENQQHLEDQQHLPSFLYDTASSPVFDFSTNNVNVANQQTSIGSMLDYSQGFSATYFEVINLLDSLLLISLVYTSLEVRTILYSCREDHHSKENTLVSYNQEMSFKAKNGMEGKGWG
ncbi:hypothetical protein JHK86_029334 [Glycine max]|nr:hypothetical protein JHK86_029334 [Glycine max]